MNGGQIVCCFGCCDIVVYFGIYFFISLEKLRTMANNRQQPDPNTRTGRPDSSIDPKNPWNRPLQKKGQESEKKEREPENKTEQQPQDNAPSGESRRPVTNQDEQRKATNVDDNNNPNDEGAI
jgi:hypothetical protein